MIALSDDQTWQNVNDITEYTLLFSNNIYRVCSCKHLLITSNQSLWLNGTLATFT